MGKVIGIDLGTTFSVVAYVNSSGKPEIIPNRDGERIMPSVVFFDNDEPIVGISAKNSSVLEPLNVVQLVKRQMGNPSYKFNTEQGIEYTAEEISAIILKRLKEDAELFLNDSIMGAVITVPAYFNDAQRKATQDAGRIAGLNVLRIINEPTAAALAYGFEKFDKPQTILVYDLGGGTFDVTILEVKSGSINVKATKGDKNLGGFNWDNEIMNYLNVEFNKINGIDLFNSPDSEQHLRTKAEEAKKILSMRDKINIILSYSGKTASIELTRQKFEELTSHLFNKTQHIMEFVLEDANLSWSNIDKILLTGGSSRMKAVESLILKVTGKKPSKEVHPDEVVALGAALQATLVENEKGIADPSTINNLPVIFVSDVNSHSMGIVTFNSDTNSYFNSIVLKKNTPVPCKVSDVFSTVSDNQTELLIQVTQGEFKDLEDTLILGEATLKIPPYPKGAPVEVFFGYDIDGIVHLVVIDLTTNKSLGEIHINRNANLNETQLIVMKNKINKLSIN
jgi:molecular chaperone DnaK